MLLKGATHTSDGRALLADSDVDAAYLLVLVAGLPVSLLVQNGIDADRGLTRLTVTDDQLALAAADRGHCVDSLDAGLHWLFNRLALQHGWCLQLEDALLFSVDWAHAVDRLTQWVNYAAEEFLAHWDGENLAGPLNLVALLEGLEVAQDHDTDRVSVKVLCDANHAAWELEQLIRHNGRQARNLRNTVSCRNDHADLLTGGLRGVARGVVRNRTTDLVGGDRQLRHVLPALGSIFQHLLKSFLSFRLRHLGTQAGNLACRGAINDFIADADAHATEEAGVNLRVNGHRTTINFAQLLSEYCLLTFV